MRNHQSNFDREFDRDRRTFNIMFRVVSTFIAVIFVCIILFWIFVGMTAINTANQIEQHGLKEVIEKIWCGPNNRCL